mgnify:CR=1 FL=1
MTVTDELLAELDRSVRVVWRDDDATVIAVDALTAELRRLRAENAELAQSLAESRANDQAAMGWLTSLRWASGDRGERMLPELVTHIEGLAKDAGRYRWLRNQSMEYRQNGPAAIMAEVSGEKGAFLELDDLDTAIDTAMATQ